MLTASPAERWDTSKMGCSEHDINPVEILGMSSTLSLLLLSGPLWPRGVVPVSATSMSQIDHWKLLVLYKNTWNHITTCKQIITIKYSFLKTYNCV